MIAALELVVAVVVWVETSWFITVWRLQSSNKSAGYTVQIANIAS